MGAVKSFAEDIQQCIYLIRRCQDGLPMQCELEYGYEGHYSYSVEAAMKAQVGSSACSLTLRYERIGAILGARLLAAGFEVLGSGHFSVALSHSLTPGVAYRVQLRASDQHHQYIRWVQEDARNTPGHTEWSLHLPWVLHHAAAYDDEHGHITALPIYESLERSPGYSAAPGFADMLSVLREIGRGDYECPSTSLESAVLAVRAALPGVTIDIHSGNIMIDITTGQYVLTDPVSFERSDYDYDAEYQP